jgi:hypothetical protein
LGFRNLQKKFESKLYQIVISETNLDMKECREHFSRDFENICNHKEALDHSNFVEQQRPRQQRPGQL